MRRKTSRLADDKPVGQRQLKQNPAGRSWVTAEGLDWIACVPGRWMGISLAPGYLTLVSGYNINKFNN